MIPLTRLSGSMFVLNSDLIERVDSTPDTVITLVDGSKYLVSESLTTVLSIVRRHRAEIVALGGLMAEDPQQLVASLADHAPAEAAAEGANGVHARNLSLVTHQAQQGLGL